MYTITRLELYLKKQNKEFKTIYLACNSIFEFQKFDETLRYPYLSILNIKNEKKEKRKKLKILS